MRVLGMELTRQQLCPGLCKQRRGLIFVGHKVSLLRLIIVLVVPLPVKSVNDDNSFKTQIYQTIRAILVLGDNSISAHVS